VQWEGQLANYWQIAAGSFGRDYACDFLRFGMAFVGGKRQIEEMDKVALGDRVILKRGVSRIAAVGQVVERDGKHKGNLDKDKDWLRDFDGWDLSAYCFVQWHKPNEDICVKGLTPGISQLAPGTIGLVRNGDLRKWTDEALACYPVPARLHPEPEPTHEVANPDILKFLIARGLRPRAAEDLTAAFDRIRLLARYYYGAPDRKDFGWDEIREHETRTFLIVPLLLALGWAEQQIKIELPIEGQKRVDIACFGKPYTTRSRKDVVLILESKRFSQGLYASGQAKEYAAHFPNCRVVVVTNGYCYKAFRRDEAGAYSVAPSAYLNLLQPRNRYPLDPCKVDGCLEALRLLLPA
jgi:hypothetical protein